MSAIQVNKQKKKKIEKKKIDVFLPSAIVSLKFVVLMIKTTFLGHFLRNTQTDSLTDSQTHPLTERWSYRAA